MNPTSRTARWSVALAVAAVAIAACSSGTDAAAPSASGSVASTAGASSDLVNPYAAVLGPITVGHERLGSSQVMAELYVRALREAGIEAQLAPAATQADLLAAIQNGAIDVMPAYSGVLANALFTAKNSDAPPPVYADAADAAATVNELAVDDGFEMLTPSPANEGAKFLVSKAFSKETGITTLSQMAEWSTTNPTRLGAEETCETRPYCKPNLEKTYGFTFQEFVPLTTDGTVVKAALMRGEADMGWMSGSDPAASSPDLVVLQEDKPLNIYRNIAPVISTDVATAEVVAALNNVTSKVTDAELGNLVNAVQVDGEPPARVTGEFIAAQGLGEGLYTGDTKVVSRPIKQKQDLPPTEAPAPGPLRIDYAPLTDTEIAARIYGGALVNAGIPVSIGDSSEPSDILAALPSGEVQFAPMRLGTIANILNTNAYGPLMQTIDSRDVNKMVADARELAEPRGITILKASTANVPSAWVVTKDYAANTGIRTLSDLAKVSQNRPVTVGGPTVCAQEAWCEPFLTDKYGIKVARLDPLDYGGALTRGALANGDVNVAWLPGNDGGIEQFGFVVLADDLGRGAVNPITPVFNSKSLTPEIQAVVDDVSTQLTTDDLKEMNHLIEFDRLEITDVVQKWLEDHDLA